MSTNPPNLKAILPTRSMGLKLIVVGGLALAMTIPTLFVSSLIDDRTHRAEQVEREVGGSLGGPQTFMGPVLAVPYSVPANAGKSSESRVYIISPAHGEAVVTTKTEVRHRSLFKVPIYQAELVFNASFDLTGVPAYAPEGALLDWQRAEFLISATDARGALSDATINAAGTTETFAPASTLDCLTLDQRQDQSPLCFFGAPAKMAQPNAKFDVKATLKFSGAQRLALLAYGKTTNISMQSDWPHPSFDGRFLPVKRSLSDHGFTADWSVPFIARGVPAEGNTGSIVLLDRNELGVSFVELADPYQAVTRSVKYALLFIGLVFLAYFVFEVTTGKRIHPAQYLLVGIAQIVFYLLLLSIAERAGFDIAFAIAAAATVALISAYAGWVFTSRKQGIRALVVFSLLYGLIYFLLRLEDEALLVGAFASFIAIAAVMYFTRRIDWYASIPGPSQAPSVDRE